MFKFDFTGITTKKYRSEDAFINAVYDQNKERFRKIHGEKISKEMFRARVKAAQRDLIQQNRERGSYNIPSLRRSIQELSNSIAFTSPDEMAYDNIIKGLKDYGRLDQFRNMLRDNKGRWLGYKQEYLTWDGNNFVYRDPKMAFSIILSFGTYDMSIVEEQ